MLQKLKVMIVSDWSQNRKKLNTMPYMWWRIAKSAPDIANCDINEYKFINGNGADSITQVRTWVYLNFSTIKTYFLCRKRSINWEHGAPLCVRILMSCMTLHTTCLILPSMGQSTWTTHFIYLHGPDSLSPIIAGILAAGIAIQIQPHLTEAFNLVPILPYTQRIYPLVRD